MTEQEKEIKLEQLFNDNDFIDKLSKVTTKETLQNLFISNGLELDREEIDEFIKSANKSIETDELSEDSLENVAGGVALGAILLYLGKICWKHRKVLIKAFKGGMKLSDWEEKIVEKYTK